MWIIQVRWLSKPSSDRESGEDVEHIDNRILCAAICNLETLHQCKGITFNRVPYFSLKF